MVGLVGYIKCRQYENRKTQLQRLSKKSGLSGRNKESYIECKAKIANTEGALSCIICPFMSVLNKYSQDISSHPIRRVPVHYALCYVLFVLFLDFVYSINQSIFICHKQFDNANDTSSLTGQQGTRVHLQLPIIKQVKNISGMTTNHKLKYYF